MLLQSRIPAVEYRMRYTSAPAGDVKINYTNWMKFGTVGAVFLSWILILVGWVS